MAVAREDSRGSFAAVTLPAPEVDPLASAASLGAAISVHFERPSDGISVIGAGVLAEERADRGAEALELLARLADPARIGFRGGDPRPPGPWFGGLAFDLAASPGALWEGFPPSRWVLPRVLLWRRAGEVHLTGFAAPSQGPELERELQGIRERLASRPPPRAAPAALSARSDRPAWDGLVAAALAAIRGGAMKKVVLARPIDVTSDRAIDPLAVASALCRAAPSCTTFAIAGQKGGAFVGATPELLCRICAGTVETMALGGSGNGGAGAESWATDKELREHAAIVDFISQALRPHCESLEVPAHPRVRELPQVAHLETDIRGALVPGKGPAEVVRALHPTPAVGGVPRERALSFLREHEGLDRGWYAGAVGWVGPGAAELCVALRCALVRGSRARIFVGAGIVEGSDAAAEWAETDAKASVVLGALGGARG